jgi:hypothetical protein
MTMDFYELADLAEERIVDEQMLDVPVYIGRVCATVRAISDEELVDMLCDEQENARIDMLNRWRFERIA